MYRVHLTDSHQFGLTTCQALMGQQTCCATLAETQWDFVFLLLLECGSIRQSHDEDLIEKQVSGS